MRIPVTGDRWSPLNTTFCHGRPEVDELIAFAHTVWKVVKVEDVPLTDSDREKWIKRGMPDLETWKQRPYRLHVDWVGGIKPDWAQEGEECPRGKMTVPAETYMTWHVYHGGRWPQCSCCGEPMPCRAEIHDGKVAASLNQLAQMEAVPPGACWGCSEIITTRQKSVAYPGDNIDFPGGPPVRFHIRKGCGYKARAYEERWLAADPRRERVLTWPECDGALVVHADGSSECVAARNPLGEDHVPQPDCRGHLTHDHGYLRACYVGSGCTRGCEREGHPGTRTTPRPERRQSDELFKWASQEQRKAS